MNDIATDPTAEETPVGFDPGADAEPVEEAPGQPRSPRYAEIADGLSGRSV